MKARLYAGTDHPSEEATAVYGIHWDTGPVWEEHAYATHDNDMALSDYNAMNNASDGALVAPYFGARAEDRDDPDPFNLNDTMPIGITPPNATVRALPYPKGTGPDADVGFLKVLPLVNTVEVSRDDDEYAPLFEDHVAGHSVYQTSEKEALIRKAYDDLRD